MTHEARIRRLERQCRLYRDLFVLAGLTLAGLLAYGALQPIPEVVQARRFQVVSDQGLLAADLNAQNGTGALNLFEGSATAHHQTVYAGTAGILVNGTRPEQKASFSIVRAANGTISVVSHNRHGQGTFLLAEKGDGHPQITLSSGVVIEGSDGGGLLAVYNKSGGVAASIYADDSGRGIIEARLRTDTDRLPPLVR